MALTSPFSEIYFLINQWMNWIWHLPFKLISVIWVGNNNFENHIWTTSFCLVATVVLQKQKWMNCDAHFVSFLHKYSCIVWSIFCEWFNYYFSEYSGRVQIHFKYRKFHYICCAFLALFKLQAFFDLSRPFQSRTWLISVLCQSICLHHFSISLIHLSFNDKIFQLHVYIQYDSYNGLLLFYPSKNLNANQKH